MLALVTGGGGFLGQYIVEQLIARGDRVRSLSRRRHPELDDIGVEQFQADLREQESACKACEGVDVVFHTAAMAGVWGPWQHYHSINTLGTQHVVDACLRQHVPRLVHSSSPSVTFDGSDQCNADESAAYARRWLCHYPHSKALAEQFVLESNGRDGLLTCALRPHLIWGPRDRHLIPRLLDRARKGQLRQVGDGTNLIDMVYVENAAAAHIQACDALQLGSLVCGRAYYISQGEPVNCWRWINEILQLAGLARVEKSISFRAAWRIGAVLEAMHFALRLRSEPRMTRFLAAQLAKSHYFSIGRAVSDFGYSPQIHTDDGMRRLAKWCGTG